MTGILIGLAFGSGLLLILSSFSSHHGPFAGRSGRRPRVRSGRSASTLVVVSIGCAVAGGVLGLVITALPIAAGLAALTGALVPTLVRRRGEARRQRTVRAAWPDAVDTLASGVRAGLSLPEAVAAVATSGPEPLRPAFTAFAIEYRVTASFPRALDALRDTAPDAVADRVAAALDLAWGCGGTELGAVLRALSRMLREDSRVRAEIEARQSWTVAAARMAVAAPFVTLAVLALRPEAASAYTTPAGAAVVAAVGIASVLAYGLMRRIARLPGDDRRPA